MKHLKPYKLFESILVHPDELDKLLDKIKETGITSLSEIEQKRLKLFSEEDKEVIDVINRMADVTIKFKELNNTLDELAKSDKGDDDIHNTYMTEWKSLNDQMIKLESEIESYGIELGDVRLSVLMAKIRPDAYAQRRDHKYGIDELEVE